MESLLNKIKQRNIKASQLQLIDDKELVLEEVEKEYTPLVWRSTSRSIRVVRTYTLENKYYFVFFIHTPTVFKTRGRYTVIERTDKEKFKLMLQMTGFTLVNFKIDTDGNISTTEEVPFLNLNNQQPFLHINETDNSRELVVEDLLDLLDFLMLFDGNIHMNPFKEVPKLTKTTEKDSRFELGKMQDYRRKVYEFVTSQEKSTLSYRYLIKGYELENGVEVEKLKFFQYPILDNKGEVGVDEIEFTIPNTEDNLYYIKKYISHLIKPSTVGIYKGNEIYFIVDTSKLKPIRTLHEVPIDYELVRNRERCRLLLKSVAGFKSMLKNMASRVGVPIREENMYTYGTLEQIKSSTPNVIYKTKHSCYDTKISNIKFKELIEKSGIKNMGYVEKMVEDYLEGKLDNDFLELNIKNSDKLFKSQSLNESIKILFTSIRGRNLKEMFDIAQFNYLALERQNNSLKLRLHLFRGSDGEIEDFLTRALSSLPSNTNLNSEEYMLLEYNMKGGVNEDLFSIEIKTEVDY